MNKKIKILHLPKWYPNQDDPQLGIFIKKQILAVSNDCDNVVLSILGSKNINSIQTIVDKNEELIEIQILYPSKGNAFKKLKRYLKALEIGLTKIADLGFYPDIVHGHVNGRIMWVANKYFKNVPTIISEHWSGYLDGRFNKMAKWKKKLYLKYYNQSKKVLCVSNHLKDALKKTGVITSIDVIDNVIDVSPKEIKKEKHFTFLMVNDLVDSIKNISGVLQSFDTFHLTHPNSQLHIIGEGKDRNQLEKLAKELNLSKSVIFLGRKEQHEVLDYYAKVHCVIVNSNFETYSMVTAEAILSGVPVIATRCNGPEQFITKTNGILIDVGNQNELLAAMKKIIHEINSYSSSEVKNSIKKDLSSNNIGRQLYSIYQSILSFPAI